MKRTPALLAGLIVSLVPVAGAAASPLAAGTALPTLTLTMTGHAIKVSGAAKAGAVTVVAKTTGESQSSPTLVALKPGASIAKALRAVGHAHGDPNALLPYATIVYNVGANKGTSSAQTVLTPGKWVAVDTEASNPAKWPLAAFTVTRGGHAAKLAKPGATVKMIDFNFTGPSTWHEGEAIRFINAGLETHMVLGVKVASMAAAQTVTSLLLAGKDQQAQAASIGFADFVGIQSPGGLQQEKITPSVASPGIYVLVCFMDTQDGREHSTIGMERTITITG